MARNISSVNDYFGAIYWKSTVAACNQSLEFDWTAASLH